MCRPKLCWVFFGTDVDIQENKKLLQTYFFGGFIRAGQRTFYFVETKENELQGCQICSRLFEIAFRNKSDSSGCLI